jgi:hypothetical protein
MPGSGDRARLKRLRNSYDEAPPPLAAHWARLVLTLKEKNLHPHSIRHSTAIALLKAAVDFATISQWLGHAGLSATMRYARADLDLKRQPISGRSRTAARWPLADGSGGRPGLAAQTLKASELSRTIAREKRDAGCARRQSSALDVF